MGTRKDAVSHGPSDPDTPSFSSRERRSSALCDGRQSRTDARMLRIYASPPRLCPQIQPIRDLQRSDRMRHK